MSHKSTTRSLAAGEQLQQSLTKFIQLELRDPRINTQDKLGLNLTEVKVSRDLAVADVRVSFMPIPESAASARDNNTQNPQSVTDKRKMILQILRGAAGFLRSRIARSSSMRSVPKLRFHYDESIEQSVKLAALLAADLNGRH